jgi:hypothetical protein
MSQARAIPMRRLLWAADEQAVWQLEKDYWRYVQAGDVESYVELWHEDFVGWPCHTKTPSDKSGIGSWVKDIREKHWKFAYTLRPMEFRTFDDIVLVHFGNVRGPGARDCTEVMRGPRP